jgi:hypothetical protein
MDRTIRRSNVEREGLPDDTAADEMVNDSLGTVDTADSTGLDPELEKEHGIERENPETEPSAARPDQAS